MVEAAARLFLFAVGASCALSGTAAFQAVEPKWLGISAGVVALLVAASFIAQSVLGELDD